MRLSPSLAVAAALVLADGCGKRLVRSLEPDIVPVVVVTEPEPSARARAWALQARVAEDQGDVDAANHAWEWAVRLDRGEPWVHLAYGRYLLRQGRTGDAIASAETALGLAQELADAHLLLGEALVRAGDDARAEPHLRTAMEAGGTPEAHHLLARLYVRGGDPTRATEVYERWTAVDVRGADALSRGRVAIDLGRDADAVDDLLRSLEGPDAMPLVGELVVGVAERSCRLGSVVEWAFREGVDRSTDPEWQRVHTSIERAVARGACDAQPWLDRAAKVPPAEAVPILEEALERDPGDAEVRRALAAAYLATGHPELAHRLKIRSTAFNGVP